VEKTGQLPAETPIVADGSLRLFTDAFNAELLSALADAASPAAWIRAQLDRLKVGDYLALLAYVPMTAPHEQSLTRMRAKVRDRRHVATCVGFGPRFLHSTGQAYKGGPNSGVFLQITCDDAEDLAVPAARYSFGVVKAAQARGDFQVLVDRKRRALRVHLGSDVSAGLALLEQIVVEAMGA
jgi:transaldolase/glucose-6-phosphate isomerase